MACRNGQDRIFARTGGTLMLSEEQILRLLAVVNDEIHLVDSLGLRIFDSHGNELAKEDATTFLVNTRDELQRMIDEIQGQVCSHCKTPIKGSVIR